MLDSAVASVRMSRSLRRLGDRSAEAGLEARELRPCGGEGDDQRHDPEHGGDGGHDGQEPRCAFDGGQRLHREVGDGVLVGILLEARHREPRRPRHRRRRSCAPAWPRWWPTTRMGGPAPTAPPWPCPVPVRRRAAMMCVMSENLTILGEYSDAMFAGDEEAVFEYWSPDFVSHVTDRVNPDAVGTDVRGHELEWWTQVRSRVPRHGVHRRPAHRVRRPDRVELDGRGHPHRHAVLRRRRRRASRSRSTAPPSCASATARSSSTGAVPTARTASASPTDHRGCRVSFSAPTDPPAIADE